jgi:hypothetical protein
VLLDLEPLVDELADRDPGAGLPLFVDLVEELGQLDLCLLLCIACFLEVSLLASQWIPTGVHDGSEPGAVVLDVASLPRSTCHKRGV